MFPELGSTGHDPAARVQHEAPAVEDQFVLAADQVAVGGGRAAFADPVPQDLRADEDLSGVVGAGGHVDEQPGPAAGRLPGGAAGDPDVLANGDGDQGARDLQQQGVFARDEISFFVEHAVVGEVALAVEGSHAPAVEEGGGIGDLARPAGRRPDQAGDVRGDARGKIFQGFLGRPEEPRDQKEVFRRITRQGEFGENDEVGAGVFRSPDVFGDADRVAGQVADRRIDLGESETEHDTP
jgi:hypothetical protein